MFQVETTTRIFTVEIKVQFFVISLTPNPQTSRGPRGRDSYRGTVGRGEGIITPEVLGPKRVTWCRLLL